VLVALLAELAVPAWFSFSARGLRTCADQPLADAFAVAGSAREVIAVGVNCCVPADVLPAVRLAVSVTGKPAVAYPNSGARWEASNARWAGESSFSAAMAREWAQAGAAFVGGCCGVGPRDVAAVAAAVG
jgi:homocysteine S-methyltransferase